MAPFTEANTLTTLFKRQPSEAAYQAALQCARPLYNDVGASLFGPGTISLRFLMVVISGPCLFLTVVGCWFLSWRHLHRWTSPQEQRQIIRIINLPIAYCLFNFLALTFTIDYMYIQPLAGIYEAFSVAALFFLVLEYVCPDGTDREKYFTNLELRGRDGSVQPGGSLKWFQRTWSSALQYPLTRTLIVVIQIVTQYYGDYCESSWSPHNAHLWLQLADWLFIGGALGAVIRFSRRLRSEVGPIHKMRPKVLSFVGILIFQIIQDLIFHTFNGKVFNPSAKVTYNDINFGISSFMTCVESVVFTAIFHWSYSSSEYKEGLRRDRLNMGPGPRMKTFRAIFDALNMSDIVAGTVLAFQLLIARYTQSRYGGRDSAGNGGLGMKMQPLRGSPELPSYEGNSSYDYSSDAELQPNAQPWPQQYPQQAQRYPQQQQQQQQQRPGMMMPPQPPQPARDISPGRMAQNYTERDMRPGSRR